MGLLQSFLFLSLLILSFLIHMSLLVLLILKFCLHLILLLFFFHILLKEALKSLFLLNNLLLLLNMPHLIDCHILIGLSLHLFLFLFLLLFASLSILFFCLAILSLTLAQLVCIYIPLHALSQLIHIQNLHLVLIINSLLC